jgi:hypothetical protein
VFTEMPVHVLQIAVLGRTGSMRFLPSPFQPAIARLSPFRPDVLDPGDTLKPSDLLPTSR